MADEFNLVPTNNTEKFLDDILRTAQGEQAQFNLVPNWRIEQYLEAIKNALAAGSGGDSSPFVVHWDTDEEELSASYNEMKEALRNGRPVIAIEADWSGISHQFTLGELKKYDGTYYATFVGAYRSNDGEANTEYLSVYSEQADANMGW